MKIQITPLTKNILDQYLAVTDLTQSEEPHAVKHLYEKIREYIERKHPTSDVRICRPSPIVSVEDNYDRLLVPKDNISRSSTYTHYVTKNTILRTHTSAAMPGILDELTRNQNWSDVIIMLPGLVYRRDVTDRTHIGVIHQLDIWRVVKTKQSKIKKSDLLEVVNGIAAIGAPGWKLRIVNSPHPYTNEGIEVNAVKGSRDIEILECGLIKEQILINAGLDPEQHSGWAMGMGLDRLVMTAKDIPDIRYLRSENSSIEKQMKDLSPYEEVSDQPSISRDLSYCVPEEYVEEDINEDIRTALGENASLLESVSLLNETEYAKLPDIARKKLGCSPKQKNVLVRIVLRHLSKTLTNEEANSIYTELYPKINYGTSGYI